ncbi:MAG: hypothetical protein ACLPXB_07565 [Thiobacillaceae bacterium]
MPHENPVNPPPNETVKRFLEDLAPLVPAILEGLDTVAVFTQQLRTAAGQVASQLEALADDMAPLLAALAQVDWPAAIRRLEDLPAKSKAAMRLAASNGWFFGWEDSLLGLMTLVQKLDVVESDEIDQVMADYYRENLEFLTVRLVAKHPDRARAILAAVDAHRALDENGYILSIPVFIAQADGLLTELAEVNSAMMKVSRNSQELQGSKALREKLAGDQAALDLICPILQLHELDFLKSAKERHETVLTTGEAFTALNRHQVMHGESLDYGTELNSLKAFSFLAFVGTHLPSVLDSYNRKPVNKPIALTDDLSY